MEWVLSTRFSIMLLFLGVILLLMYFRDDLFSKKVSKVVAGVGSLCSLYSLVIRIMIDLSANGH